MKAKELKRLSRSDLLEMLLDLSRENDRLNRELTELRQKMAQRTIVLEESGSLAEAALRLNGIFEAAQAACDQYTENIRTRDGETEERCRRIEAEAREKAEAIVAEARAQARKLVEEQASRQAALEQEQRWLLDILGGGESE